MCDKQNKRLCFQYCDRTKKSVKKKRKPDWREKGWWLRCMCLIENFNIHFARCVHERTTNKNAEQNSRQFSPQPQNELKTKTKLESQASSGFICQVWLLLLRFFLSHCSFGLLIFPRNLRCSNIYLLIEKPNEKNKRIEILFLFVRFECWECVGVAVFPLFVIVPYFFFVSKLLKKKLWS